MHPRPRETKLAAKKNGILNEVFRSGGCLRFDLARRLNINATMVGNYVDELLGEGLLVEGDPAAAPRGRAPLLINPEHGAFLGLDFEALRARAVACDFAGNVIAQEELAFPAEVSREKVLKRIVALAKRLVARIKAPLLSVGVAAPGQVDCEAGRVIHYRLLPDFDQVPIRDRFQEVVEAPVFVEDNIRAVAYGELLRGSGRGIRNFLCLAVRSGVGLGIVVNGELYSGAHSMAGEVGYMVFPTPEGPRLATDLVSATGFVDATVKAMKSRKPTDIRKRLLQERDRVDLADIVAAAREGDEWCREALERLGTHLGMLAASLANLFAPEKLVLAGEVPGCSPLVRQQMERTFRQYTLPTILATAYLEDGTLGGYAGALGAAWQGFARTFPVSESILVSRAKEKFERQRGEFAAEA
ncbi:Glucokinase [Planctomycetes bacterium Pan216]|uniref:Glucokinase n=1 Tax=Kolteria novifilia TaxID=2527975 RepID=A0A518BBF1_9BACT|nr:Glucokinase [Planctomycetes bacterium Pan216]